MTLTILLALTSVSPPPSAPLSTRQRTLDKLTREAVQTHVITAKDCRSRPTQSPPTMPRKIAPALPNTISRLLQGSYLKTAPRIHQVLLDHPPPTLPPRSALPRPASAQDLRPTPRPTRKAAARNLPAHLKLAPRPISYLADNVRRRFFEDHPWERARVVTLTEGKELASSEGEAKARKAAEQGLEVDLSLWGANPSAEE